MGFGAAFWGSGLVFGAGLFLGAGLFFGVQGWILGFGGRFLGSGLVLGVLAVLGLDFGVQGWFGAGLFLGAGLFFWFGDVFGVQGWILGQCPRTAGCGSGDPQAAAIPRNPGMLRSSAEPEHQRCRDSPSCD